MTGDRATPVAVLLVRINGRGRDRCSTAGEGSGGAADTDERTPVAPEVIPTEKPAVLPPL